MLETVPPDTERATMVRWLLLLLAADNPGVSGPSARVVADSVSEDGIRLTTMEVRLHRFVLAELNTHRVSRNSALSRAIPVAKQIQHVRDDPAMPVGVRHQARGDAGRTGTPRRRTGRGSPNLARRPGRRCRRRVRPGLGGCPQTGGQSAPGTVHVAHRDRERDGVEGFFAQRCSPLAQPEIRLAEEAMRAALDASSPVPCPPGRWHLPYIRPDDTEAAGDEFVLCQISAARCGRVRT